MVREGMASRIRDEHPDGGEYSVRDLIKYALVESDGTASDVLMNTAGGPNVVRSYLSQIGVNEMQVMSSEKELGANWDVQYQNWTTPRSAVELLRWLENAATDKDEKTGDPSAESELIKYMTESTPGAERLKGLLPKGTIVAHKTGTSGTQNGVTAATNDIGLITLPDGRRFAIAVFVSDSKAEQKQREAVIAQLAKAAWNKWSRSGPKNNSNGTDPPH